MKDILNIETLLENSFNCVMWSLLKNTMSMGDQERREQNGPL